MHVLPHVCTQESATLKHDNAPKKTAAAVRSKSLPSLTGRANPQRSLNAPSASTRNSNASAGNNKTAVTALPAGSTGPNATSSSGGSNEQNNQQAAATASAAPAPGGEAEAVVKVDRKRTGGQLQICRELQGLLEGMIEVGHHSKST